MANNPALFNAIIAGITGGNQDRWTSENPETDYTVFQAVVTVIALDIDALIPPIPGGASYAQARLMQSICHGVFTDRSAEFLRHEYPTVLSNIVSLFNS